MLQTAYGTLTVGLEARAGQSTLIRGGTSSVGMAAIVLAKRRGLQVIATTRREAAAAKLTQLGADHVVIDDGAIAGWVRGLFPDGVDCAVELVGVNVLKGTLRCVRTGGTACFTGVLSDEWTIHEFYPMDWIPVGVRLTVYSGNSSHLSSGALQEFIDAVYAGQVTVPLGRSYRMEDIVQAHRDMEVGVVGGKGVVLT